MSDWAGLVWLVVLLLVNAFFVSMLALIPGHNLGLGAAIMAVLSLYHTLRLHLGHFLGLRCV